MVSKPISENLFNNFAIDYDRMINWPTRLMRETPFFQKVFAEVNASKVLDSACGTGHHTMLFASWGLNASGWDVSRDMIAKAQQAAAEAGWDIDFRARGLEEADSEFAEEFDAVTCIGNSLPHVKSVDNLKRAFVSWHNLLKPGGLILLQLRNYHRVIAREEKFMPLNTRVEDGKEFLYLRMTEMGNEFVTFNIIVLVKDEAGNWSYRVESEKLKPWLAPDIEAILNETGFSITGKYGDFGFSSFDSRDSTDLIIVARKS